MLRASIARMPEDPSDPPRKFYEFKPRDFDRVNAAPREVAPPTPPASGVPPPDVSQPIDVHELHRQASVPGPALSNNRTTPENDIHAMLRDNLARENAAGLNRVSVERSKKLRRTRDYLMLIVVGDGALGTFAVHAFHTGNTVGFVSAVAGVGGFTAAVTWIMWFVMDRY